MHAFLIVATTNFTTTTQNTTPGMSSVTMTTVTKATVTMATATMATNRSTTTTAPKPGMSIDVMAAAVVGGIIFLILLGVALIVLACRVGRRRGRLEQKRQDQDVESAGTPSTDSGHVSRPPTPGDEPRGGTELIPLSDLPLGKNRPPASLPRSSSRDEREWIPFAQLEAARTNWDDTELPPSDPPDVDDDVYAVIPERQNAKDEDDNIYDTPPVDQDGGDNLYDTPPADQDGDDSLYHTPPNEEDYYTSIGESKLQIQPKPQEGQKPSDDAIDQMYAKVDKSMKKRQTHQPALETKDDPPEDTGNYYFTLEEATGLKKESTKVEKEKKRPATWPTESTEGRTRIQGEV
ncbi:PREDICTED: uncharacterized protein LOC109486040 [Branchiostoma belcheri]|uniref:Uncharacterized protein LOC109486040 n=1 Tax=Branchiostoma belcheri TaxID=7741 RepID=A0A6P5ATF0_BRABE|nr:PREDICTED: uncharacterized protein LOC109486040 [Branchiostoma belcheri]